jgi:hypothetical protein
MWRVRKSLVSALARLVCPVISRPAVPCSLPNAARRATGKRGRSRRVELVAGEGYLDVRSRQTLGEEVAGEPEGDLGLGRLSSGELDGGGGGALCDRVPELCGIL